MAERNFISRRNFLGFDRRPRNEARTDPLELEAVSETSFYLSRRDFLGLMGIEAASLFLRLKTAELSSWSGLESLDGVGRTILANKDNLLERWKHEHDVQDYWNGSLDNRKGDCEDFVFALWDCLRGMALSGNRRLEGRFWNVTFAHFLLTYSGGRTNFQRIEINSLPSHAFLAVKNPAASVGADWYLTDNSFMVPKGLLFGPSPVEGVMAANFAQATAKWSSPCVSGNQIQWTLTLPDKAWALSLPSGGVRDGEKYKSDFYKNARVIYQRS